MRFDNLSAWLEWQSTLNLNEIELGLSRVRTVWERLAFGSFDHPVVTVAGTNGKGSSVATLEAIYSSAGYRTCTYTSPHLQHYNERIRLNGEMVRDELLLNAFERIDRERDDLPLTYFEFSTLAALLIAHEFSADVLILEVGLGGRLDAVNIIDADVCLITSIELDHTDWLGDTRDQIALEKAGVMRRGASCVYSSADMPTSIASAAAACESILLRLNENYSIQLDAGSWRWCGEQKSIAGLPYPSLRGAHQIENAAGVIQVVQQLYSRLPVPTSAIREGLIAAIPEGRFQMVQARCKWFLDVAHNVAAVHSLKNNLLSELNSQKYIAIYAAVSDKNSAQIIQRMADIVDCWIFVGTSGARGQTAAQLLDAIGEPVSGLEHVLCADYPDAFRQAEQMAEADDAVVCFGSFQLVAAAMAYLEPRNRS